VDVGAGSGILSIFAATACSKKVYAIENAGIVKACRQNIKERNLEGVIEVIHSLAEDASLPFEKADVIVSEWIGYFLLFVRMLPSVLSVRDRYLKQGGIMIPQRAKILVAGVSEGKNSYGISLSGAEIPKYAIPQIITIAKDRIITSVG